MSIRHIVDIILSNLLFKEGHTRFTTVTFKPLSDEQDILIFLAVNLFFTIVVYLVSNGFMHKSMKETVIIQHV